MVQLQKQEESCLVRLNVTDYFANRQSSMLIGLEGLTVAAAAAPAPKTEIEKAGAAAMV